ncbi:MAG: hypothetical protein JSU08_06935 [Acidobacteria bacterium]|nr:hypothetical protein [Acidobacteriota bacterium]
MPPVWVTTRPGSVPIAFTRQSSTSGSGHAINVGVHAVRNRIEVGVGARGLANQMAWSHVETTTYSLRSLTSGNSDFVESPGPTLDQLQTTIPVEYRFNGAYHADGVSVLGDLRHGFNGTSAHVGAEYRRKLVELRGGVRRSSGYWNPGAGVGWNVGARLGIDVGWFTTTANIERRRDHGLAVSLRIMPVRQD